MGSWFSDIFSGEASSPSPAPSAPVDPIALVAPAVEKVASVTKTVLGVVPVSYTWIQQKENSEFLMTFFKNFWNYNFLTTVVFRLHLVIRAWSRIFTNKKELVKFPGAFKTFQALARFLSKNGSSGGGVDKEMINWLYIRFMVHPSSMIRVLYRVWRKKLNPAGEVENEEKLKCNGPVKGKKKKEGGQSWVACFIDKDGSKLTTEMSNFLKQGQSPKGMESERK